MRVLQISADRSKRGILYPETLAFERQRAYARNFGNLDVIAFTRDSDTAQKYSDAQLTISPTGSSSVLRYGLDALRIAKGVWKPTVVTAQDPFETGLAALRIARKFGVPLHIQVHTDFLSPEYARHSLKNRIRVWIAEYVLRRASRIRVVSDRIRESLQKEYHLLTPISVLPIFVDIHAYQNIPVDPALAARFERFKTKLLVVSRLEPEKNVGLAIGSFAQSASHEACLIIVGAGSERVNLERQVRDLRVSDRVFFEGEQPGIGYYQLADLVLVTSKYEGYGLVIVEALAAGKPVLSTDVGVAREAGAFIVTESQFPAALGTWFRKGPQTAELKAYPYKNFDDYVRAYCDDVRECVK